MGIFEGDIQLKKHTNIDGWGKETITYTIWLDGDIAEPVFNLVYGFGPYLVLHTEGGHFDDGKGHVFDVSPGDMVVKIISPLGWQYSMCEVVIVHP